MTTGEWLQPSDASDLEPKTIERPRITPDDFVEDGNSERAIRFAASWEEAYRARDLTAIVGCGDARFVYNPHGAFAYRAIAATVPTELVGSRGILSRKFGTRHAAVIAHHAGSSVQPGKRPEGCGGSAEKAKLRESGSDGKSDTGEGAVKFVEQRIPHEDPIISASFHAIRIAEGAGIPALGITEDHETGDLHVLTAAVPTRRGGVEIISDISLSQLLEGQYREDAVYENGIPALSEDRIPDEFQPFLLRHKSYVVDLRRRHPNFAQTQRVQNPDTVLFTSVIRPSRGRLPHISGSSANRVFAITVARDPNEVSGDVSLQSLQDASNELHYPLTKAKESQGIPGMPFSALYGSGTVILETKNMARSRRLAMELLERAWFREWADIDGNKIIVAQTRKGVVHNAVYFED